MLTANVVLLLAALHAGIAAGVRDKPSGTFPMPRLQINLDLPPEERWGPVLNHWDLKQLRSIYEGIFNKLIPLEAAPLVELIGRSVDEILPPSYAGEIRGMAKTMNISLGKMTSLNILYDILVYCTSIVAQDSNGTIWHGRNMDLGEITRPLRNITAILDFQSNGKTLYTTTSFVGSLGVHTGMKPNKFSISINERDKGSLPENILQMLQAAVKKNVRFTSFIARDALEHDNSYEEALRRVVNEHQVSPVYVILGGVNPGEGAVVTRERTYTLDVWRLDLSNNTNRWFVLETNYDRWTTPPPDDNRRGPGMKYMNAVGQSKVDDQAIWDVLSKWPLFNVETIFTTTMCAARPDLYTSKLRNLFGS